MELEYKSLREEIILSMKTVKNYNNLLYTVVGALLAYAFDSKNPILFLLPFVVIIPLYFLIKREMLQTLRIGSYIYVFIEKNYTEINWETRLIKYDKLLSSYNKHRKIPNDAYIFVSFTCILLSIIYTSKNDIYELTICTILQTILGLLSIYCFIIRRVDYTKEKNQYIKEWKIIKEKENKL
jgi:hypothetical protein